VSSPFVITADHRGLLFGRRTHHFLWGCGFLAAAMVAPSPEWRAALAAVGAGMVAHDWADRGVAFRDFLRHPDSR
jgi:hypothetical protein